MPLASKPLISTKKTIFYTNQSIKCPVASVFYSTLMIMTDSLIVRVIFIQEAKVINYAKFHKHSNKNGTSLLFNSIVSNVLHIICPMSCIATILTTRENVKQGKKGLPPESSENQP